MSILGRFTCEVDEAKVIVQDNHLAVGDNFRRKEREIS